MRDHRSRSAPEDPFKTKPGLVFSSSKEKAKPGFLPPPDARG
jgi:hypothetical protein